MINLEKLFQRDDEIFISINYFIQSIIIFLTLYVSSILNEHIIYDLISFQLFINSDYFYFTIIVSLSHVLGFAFVKKIQKLCENAIFFFIL